ncbi:MAG TPA: hypothetical protein VFZ83_04805 [Acidimicrobiia bacterium]|nr:hypothetical protein [Acidimicrobiia bacterium]
MGPVPARSAAVQDAPTADPHDAAVVPAGGTHEPIPWLAVVGVLVVVSVPLVVAAVALRRPHWFPVLDLAMTELRVRDVGSTHTPLIGLPGRIGTSLLEQGSHPGPLSFYLLTPTYRLLGSSPWALQASTVVVNIAASVTALAIAGRHGGRRLVLVVGVVLAVLGSGYGIATLVEPWNPYLPLMWWVALLLAVWSVLDGDLPMLPVAVFAGSFCAQTHVPYLGLAGGLGVLAAIGVALTWRARRHDPIARRGVLRWAAVALALGIVLWTPPVIDQVVNDPGNLRKLADHFGSPPEDPIGLGRGVELALLHLDVAAFVGGESGANGSLVDASSDPDGSVAPGIAVLVVWAAAAVVAWRRRRWSLLRLHVVIGVALVLGVISMSRIFGKDWFYLMLWAWAIAAFVVLAVIWTCLDVLRDRMAPATAKRATAIGGALLVVVLVVSSTVFAVDAADAEPPAPNLSSTLGAVLPPTIAALERGEGVATGRDGRYVVTWTDAFYFGSQGYGLVSELRRAGFDAGAARPFQVPITPHRVVERADATALIHLATGIFVERWRAIPEAVEVAYVEPRTDAQLEEFAALRAQVVAELRADGLDDLVPIVDGNLFGASIDERVSVETQRRMARMLELGQETAIFIAPPETELPL